jgi:hypothetical protein
MSALKVLSKSFDTENLREASYMLTIFLLVVTN